LQGTTDRTLTKKVAASYIAAYDILLATDALKSSDQLKTEQNRSTLALPKLARNVGKFDVSKNYICNMAQVIDPANNIKKNRTYRFAFPPMIDITSETYVRNKAQNNDEFLSMRRRVDTSVSRVYQLVTENVQLTCSFHIAIEVCDADDNDNNPVIRELKAHAKSKSQGDLLTSPMLANDFFKYVRVFVVAKPKSMLDKTNFYNFASVRGLCIQTPEFQLVNRSVISPNYVTVYALSGFSVDNVISFMQKDVPILKVQSRTAMKPNQRAQLTREFNTWLVRYYLDWKRMGDSFQITHLKDLITANKQVMRSATSAEKRIQLYHPYHFISIDILAIVQCIMHGVHFIYEKSDNAYVIGNLATNNEFVTYQMSKKNRININIQNQNKMARMYENMENAAGTLLGFQNNNNNVNSNSNRNGNQGPNTR
jgi:hypothetical protein